MASLASTAMPSASLPQSVQAEIARQCHQFRVTIIHGQTGCGKSTKVPQVLLDALSAKRDPRTVICTQPRRLAVVTIAERVASERGCTLGSEVGYVIGQRSMLSGGNATRLQFTTAGSLLERLRTKGESALTGVRYVIIDEVHERSVENDLLLATLRQMLIFASRKRSSAEAKILQKVNLVVMSATFERDKYRAYFAAVPEAGVNVVLIPSNEGFGGTGSASGIQGRIKKCYLEQAVHLLGQVDSNGDEASRARCLHSHPTSASASAVIGSDLLKLTGDLVMAQCRELSAIEAAEQLPPNSLAILVFCPTYRAIELVHSALDDSQVSFTRRFEQRHAQRIASIEQRLSAVIAELDAHKHPRRGNGKSFKDEAAAREREYSACRAELAAAKKDHHWSAAMDEDAALAVHVLHSSLDVEALSSEALGQHQGPSATEEGASGAVASSNGGAKTPPASRRVFLATSIAESSVTIPNLAVVIDLARANRAFWDAERRTSFARLEWASQDACEQRRGRTGRTCTGAAYTLVPSSFAMRGLPAYEPPALQRGSLREEALAAMCSRSKATKNPAALFAGCLDPPDPTILTHALKHLLSVKMLKSTSPSSSPDVVNLSPGNLEPTVLGRLLTALPVRLDAGMLAIACAKQGLLREGATLAALMCTTPLPIESAFKDPTVLERRLRHFGGAELFASTPSSSPYGGGGYTGGNGSKPFADPDQVLEAHLGAVMAHCQWADALRCADPNARATHADRLRAATAEEEEDEATSHDCDNAGAAASASRATTRAASNTKARRSAVAAAEEQDDDDDEGSAEEGALYSEAVWCQQGGLSSVSLAAVADCAACVEAALLSDDLNPLYSVRFANLAARALREAEDDSGMSTSSSVSAQNGNSRLPYEPRGWVGASSGKPSEVLGSARISMLRKILRQRHAEQNAAQASAAAAAVAAANAAGHGSRGARDRRPPCTFFLQGRCAKGAECRFSHSSGPPSAYGLRGGGAHSAEEEGRDLGYDNDDDDALSDACEEEDCDSERDPFENSDDAVLLLGEGSFEYAAALSAVPGWGRRVIATSVADEPPAGPPSSSGLSHWQGSRRRPTTGEAVPACVAAVRQAGGACLFNVDATKLAAAFSLDAPSSSSSSSSTSSGGLAARVAAPTWTTTGSSSSSIRLQRPNLSSHRLPAIGRVEFNYPEANAPPSLLPKATANADDDEASLHVDQVLGVDWSAGDARRQRLFLAKCFRSLTALAALGVLRPDARVHIRLQAGQFARWRVLEGARRSLWTLAGCVNEEDDFDGAGFLTSASYTPGRLMYAANDSTNNRSSQHQGVWKPLLPRSARRFVFRLAARVAPPLAPPVLWKPGDLDDARHPAFQPQDSHPQDALVTCARSGKRARLLALVLRCGWGLNKTSLAEALVALRHQSNDHHSGPRTRASSSSSPSLAHLPLPELRRLVVAELRRLAAAEACPVCLERPAEGGGSSGSACQKGVGAAWRCVHAVCSPCLASMEQHGLTGSCPICRAPNSSAV